MGMAYLREFIVIPEGNMLLHIIQLKYIIITWGNKYVDKCSKICNIVKLEMV